MIDKDFLIKTTEEYLKESPNYLVDISLIGGNNITIEIDNDQGVDIEDCVAISRHIESKLNQEELDFELTVTSAGLTSKFKTLRQYKKYEGKEVEVLTKKGQKITGLLKSSDDNGFIVIVNKKEKPDGAKRKVQIEEEIHFTFDEIKYTKYLISFK